MLEGVNVAAISPRRESGHEIDLGLTFEVIDFLCSKGARGIALMGTTGEYVHYDFEQRSRVVGLVVRRSRVPVIVNVTHTTLDGSAYLGRQAADAGAAAVLVMPPYYFRYGQDELRAFFLEFAEEADLEIPVYLYNVPFFTSPMEPETACELLGSGLFAGIKDSSGRLDYFEALKRQREQRPFNLLIGNDSIFVEARGAGADGVVSGCACAVPELMLGLDRAVLARDQERIGLLKNRLDAFISWIDEFPVPIGIKEALAARGLKVGPHAVPLGEKGSRRLEEFRAWLEDWIPAVVRESSV